MKRQGVLLSLAFFVTVMAVGTILGTMRTSTKVGAGAPVVQVSKAAAWIWADDTEQFVSYLEQYARLTSMSFHRTEMGSSQKMNVDVRYLEMKVDGLRIVIVSGVRGKYSASVFVNGEQRDWLDRWDHFRDYVKGRYAWEDIPRPA